MTVSITLCRRTWLWLSVLFLIGCDQAVPQPQPATLSPPSTGGSAPPPPAVAVKRDGAQSSALPHAVSAQSSSAPTTGANLQEAESFARQLETAVASGQAAQINALIDWHKFLDRVLSGIDIVPDARQIMEKSFLQRVQTSGLAATILDATKKGGTFHVLRTHEVDGGLRCLCRLVSLESGFNYHDFILSTSTSGQIKAVDAYVFSAGETFSQFTRRQVLPLLVSSNAAPASSLTPQEQEYVAHTDTLKQLMSRLQTRDYRGALQVWNMFPPGVKANKSIMLMRITAAQRGLLKQEYAEALAELRRVYAHEPWISLVSIDAFTLQEKYADAHAAVNELEKAVGGDPFLDAVRGNIYFKQKDYAAAEQAARKSISAVPDAQKGYWVLVDTSLAQQDFGATSNALTSLAKLGMKPSDVERLPIFAEYQKSAEYRDWRAAHGS